MSQANQSVDTKAMDVANFELPPVSEDDGGFSEGEEASSVNSAEDTNAADQEQEELAAGETKVAHVLKMILGFVLFASAAGVGAFIYVYTRRSEVDEFEESFEQFSQLIVDTVQAAAQNRLEAIGALATQITAYAVNSNSSWPFVTVPHFERQATIMNSLIRAYGVNWCPIVPNEMRGEWEAYSLEHKQWVNESYATQMDMLGESYEVPKQPNQTWFDTLWGQPFTHPKNPSFSSGIADQMFDLFDPEDASYYGPIISPSDRQIFIPLWQAAPLSPFYQGLINLEFASFPLFYNGTFLSMASGAAFVTEAWIDTRIEGYFTTTSYPIHADFEDSDSAVVGVVNADIHWGDYLTGILPNNAQGIVVVIENTLGQVFTYEIYGPDVTYLGEGDLHDVSFGYLKDEFLFGEQLHESARSDSSYVGASLHDFIQYSFRIYPSQDLEDEYVTNQPVVYTIITCLIFLVTSFFFIMYDCIVERRQKLVMTTAMKSDAIVSSLFPHAVKHRLYGNDEPKEVKTKEGSQRDHTGEPLQGMMDKLDKPAGSMAREGPPIAHLYEASTVFFADICGFTAWSSGRPPVDVFLLLETCYGAFDEIAKRRGVFKIETIGDCYVAVSGVPEPRSDHAVVMAKFARAVVVAFAKEVAELQAVLGVDTLELSLRVGIHSGPVTAGVLRGEKARFQLFGDTMNTAARMESTSAPNRIQISQGMADLLILAGKAPWIEPRQDKVTPKGKGEMQTYWIKEISAPSVATTEFESTHHSDEDGEL